jgi:hypothetical protein
MFSIVKMELTALKQVYVGKMIHAQLYRNVMQKKACVKSNHFVSMVALLWFKMLRL